MNFVHLIPRKIFKFVAIKCQILSLKCNKFDFGWGSTPDLNGELIALLRPLALFKGLLLKKRRGRGRKWRGIGQEKWRGGKRRGAKRRKGRAPARFGLHPKFDLVSPSHHIIDLSFFSQFEPKAKPLKAEAKISLGRDLDCGQWL